MKKIIILIAMLCSFGFSKCAITKDVISVEFSCQPSEYEMKNVNHIDFTVYSYDNNSISHIIVETLYMDNSKIQEIYFKNYNKNKHEKIISTASNEAIIEETRHIDKYGITIETKQRVVDIDLISLYSDFKKAYKL